MSKHRKEAACSPSEIGMGLDELVRRGARQVIQQVIETELAQLLEQFGNVKTLLASVPWCATAICRSAKCSARRGPLR